VLIPLEPSKQIGKDWIDTPNDSISNFVTKTAVESYFTKKLHTVIFDEFFPDSSPNAGNR